METRHVVKEAKRQYAALDAGSKAEYLEKEAADIERYLREVAAAKAAVAAEAVHRFAVHLEGGEPVLVKMMHLMSIGDDK